MTAQKLKVIRPTVMGPLIYKNNETHKKKIISAAIISVLSFLHVPR